MSPELATVLIGGGFAAVFLLWLAAIKFGDRFGIPAPPIVGQALVVVAVLGFACMLYGVWKGDQGLRMGGLLVCFLSQAFKGMLRPAKPAATSSAS